MVQANDMTEARRQMVQALDLTDNWARVMVADAEVGPAASKRDFAFRTSAVSPSRKLGSV